MRSAVALSFALVGLSLAACGAGGSGGSPAEPGPVAENARTAQSAETAQNAQTVDNAETAQAGRVDTRRADHEAAQVVVAAPPSTRPLVALRALGDGDAEDGAGHLVHGARCVAVDLDARAFPPRALDPVLLVGALRFVHYTHPSVGVLRFTLDDARRLPLGAAVSVQYGEDTRGRRVLFQALSREDLAGLAL